MGRIIRGMLPHKTARGAAALQRLKVLRLKSYRNSCQVGDLMSNLGWNKADICKSLEVKRKEKSQTYYERKQKKELAWKKTFTDGRLAKVNGELAKFGF